MGTLLSKANSELRGGQSWTKFFGPSVAYDITIDRASMEPIRDDSGAVTGEEQFTLTGTLNRAGIIDMNSVAAAVNVINVGGEQVTVVLNPEAVTITPGAVVNGQFYPSEYPFKQTEDKSQKVYQFNPGDTVKDGSPRGWKFGAVMDAIAAAYRAGGHNMGDNGRDITTGDRIIVARTGQVPSKSGKGNAYTYTAWYFCTTSAGLSPSALVGMNTAAPQPAPTPVAPVTPAPVAQPVAQAAPVAAPPADGSPEQMAQLQAQIEALKAQQAAAAQQPAPANSLADFA